MVPELQKKKYDHSSICLLIALVSEVSHCDFSLLMLLLFLFTVNDFFRDVEGNMFEDIMLNHVGVSHLLPTTEEEDDQSDEADQIVSESSNDSSGFPQISFCTLKKCSKKKKKKLKKKTMSLKKPQSLLRLRPNMLRPAVHKSQHHSSIASRQQSLVSSVSDSER